MYTCGRCSVSSFPGGMCRGCLEWGQGGNEWRFLFSITVFTYFLYQLDIIFFCRALSPCLGSEEHCKQQILFSWENGLPWARDSRTHSKPPLLPLLCFLAGSHCVGLSACSSSSGHGHWVLKPGAHVNFCSFISEVISFVHGTSERKRLRELSARGNREVSSLPSYRFHHRMSRKSREAGGWTRQMAITQQVPSDSESRHGLPVTRLSSIEILELFLF